MLPIPPLNFSGGAAYGGTVGGGNGWNQGSWVVNVAGSGTANQTATAAGPLAASPLLILAAAAAAYFLLRK